jgi:choline kinase
MQPPKTSASPTLAVILAAGDGTRIQPASGEAVSKPLVQLFGQHLIERTMLTLAHAGIRRFRIVVGAHHERVERTIRALPHLGDLGLEFVMSHEYKKGGGYSLAAGARGIEESFVLSMGDHVFDLATVRAFFGRIAEHPDWPQLCTDPDITGNFDIDDATKVCTENGVIKDIGKELSAYNEIDMGLFVFPAGYAQKIALAIEGGATSISEILMYNREREDFHTALIPGAVWYDVDTPEVYAEAERHLSAIEPLVR